MTFSIVARDPIANLLGVATTTGGPAVGSLVPHIRANVGAIATQADTNPYFGFDGLDLLQQGKNCQETLDQVVAGDVENHLRQCIMISPTDGPVHFTGDKVYLKKGFVLDQHFAVAGNLLSNEDVPNAVAQAFREHAELPLADRMLVALKSGQAAGGDGRGIRSAALKITGDVTYPLVDLRVDWSKTPLEDLEQALQAIREPDYKLFFEQRPKR